jgi:hypothetical protein
MNKIALVDKLIIFVGIFCGSGVFWGNLTRLIPINPNYEFSWVKVVASGFLFLFAVWFLFEKASEQKGITRFNSEG